MASTRIVMHPGAIERLLRGSQAKAYQHKQGRQIADAWKANIHRVTGATAASVDVEQDGDLVIVAADRTRSPESAWNYLEFGTSSMRAQAPGRRAVRGR